MFKYVLIFFRVRMLVWLFVNTLSGRLWWWCWDCCSAAFSLCWKLKSCMLLLPLENLLRSLPPSGNHWSTHRLTKTSSYNAKLTYNRRINVSIELSVLTSIETVWFSHLCSFSIELTLIIMILILVVFFPLRSCRQWKSLDRDRLLGLR